MDDNEIIQKWKKGLGKKQLAKIYRREYNQQIKMIRSSVRHRHDGIFLTNYEALKKIEQTIYRYLQKNRSDDE